MAHSQVKKIVQEEITKTEPSDSFVSSLLRYNRGIEFEGAVWGYDSEEFRDAVKNTASQFLVDVDWIEKNKVEYSTYMGWASAFYTAYEEFESSLRKKAVDKGHSIV